MAYSDLSNHVAANIGRVKVDLLIPNVLTGEGGISRVAAVLVSALGAIGSIDIRPVVTRSSIKVKAAEILLPLFLLRYFLRMFYNRPNLVHVNLSVGGSLFRKSLYISIARLFRVPYLIHLHGAQFDEYYSSSPTLVKQLIKWMFRATAASVVLGEYWRDFAINILEVKPASVVIIDNAAFTPSPDEHLSTSVPHILFLGAVGIRKGAPEFLVALSDIRLSSLSWHATIAGEGDILPFEVQRDELGLRNRVTFTGWVGQAQVDRLLRQADVFVLPSRGENQPMSLIEAMGTGLAVISTPVGAVPEMIEDGQNGLIVPVGDPDALADAICRLLLQDELRTALGTAARVTYVERFLPAIQAKKFAALYKSIVARHRD